MFASLEALISTVFLAATASVAGILPMRKLIQIREAKHELKQGSAGYLRSISGWFFVGAWLLITWFCATITGDWWATQDLDGALVRSGHRLRIIIEVLAALLDD